MKEGGRAGASRPSQLPTLDPSRGSTYDWQRRGAQPVPADRNRASEYVGTQETAASAQHRPSWAGQTDSLPTVALERLLDVTDGLVCHVKAYHARIRRKADGAAWGRTCTSDEKIDAEQQHGQASGAVDMRLGVSDEKAVLPPSESQTGDSDVATHVRLKALLP